MYPEFVLISAGQSYFDQAKKQFENHNQFANNRPQSVKYKNKYIQQLSLQPKFVDSNLTKNGFSQSEFIKNKTLDMDKIDLVIVSPLKKSLQTCFCIFQNQKHIKLIIEPLLADQLNSAHSLPNLSQRQCQKYQNFVNKQLLGTGWVNEVLPNIHIQLEKRKDLMTLLKQKKGQLQTKQAFIKRLSKLKDKMIHYMQKTKNKLLANLFATNFLENGTPVNPVKLKHGQVQVCNIIMDNIQTQEQSLIPFCS